MLKKLQSDNYINGLDGLRAFAVLAVVFYHFGFFWADGGFLGVDIFFVISGFLITSNILKQKSESNFSLRSFWIRRVRRLLPAVYIMVIAVFVWTAVFKPDIVATIKGDAVAAFVYMSNWWLIFHKVSYFDSFDPEPFKNLWSLAIEEQFYIIWPILLGIGLKVLKTGKKLANVIFFAVLCSAVLMAIIYKPGEDPSRVYYGTDTRAFELLIGCWLALIFPMKNLSSNVPSVRKRYIINVAAAIAFTAFILSVVFINEYESFMYRGGLLIFDLNSALLIACVCSAGNYLGRFLSLEPFNWIGKRSYGIYLWHYPIYVLSTPVSEIGNPNYLRVAVQFVLTLVIAEISYRFIEMPIRKYGFKEISKRCFLIDTAASKKAAKASGSGRRRYHVRWIPITSVVLVSVLAVVTACKINSSLAASSEQLSRGTMAHPNQFSSSAPSNPNESSSDVTTSSGQSSSSAPAGSKQSSSSAVTSSNQTSSDQTSGVSGEGVLPARDPYNKVLAIGDSVMLDIAQSLNEKYTNITVDGKVGRQLYQAINLAPQYSQFDDANDAVVIELGTNGYFTENQLAELIGCFSKAHIYLVNTRVPREWESSVNNALSKEAYGKDNITLIDWHSVAIKHPEYFTPDGVHLNTGGIDEMVYLIDEALNAKN